MKKPVLIFLIIISQQSSKQVFANTPNCATHFTPVEEVAQIGTLVKSVESFAAALYADYGFNAFLSDQISISRTVPDIRPESCRNCTYAATTLPKVAVIITFYNERLSVLLRTINGILLRSPSDLLEEIIIVDDGSDLTETAWELYWQSHSQLPVQWHKLKRLQLPKRQGLMVARMTGARAVSEAVEVLIFLDSHVEVMHNWLPPLLEPISLNRKTCTCPVIDTINAQNFNYETESLQRGYFSWSMAFISSGLFACELNDLGKNFRNYVMQGGGLAISKDFFWQLGGFDEGMEIWGGEQFEMSFKIWMCGGEILSVPCSRIGHLYRDVARSASQIFYKDFKFHCKNVKRVVDVWLDKKQREIVYKKNSCIKEADAGDIADRLALRNQLKCKNFAWMLNKKMPDEKIILLSENAGYQAAGAIRNILAHDLCLTDNFEHPGPLRSCVGARNPFWYFDGQGRLYMEPEKCLEAIGFDLRTSPCRDDIFSNQNWYYNRRTMWISPVKAGKFCLTANGQYVGLRFCDEKVLAMKWQLDKRNETLIDKLTEYFEKRNSYN